MSRHHVRCARHYPAALAALLAFVATTATASTVTYTDSASFFGALPGPATTLDFEGLAAGTLLPSGSTVDGVTFTYAIDGLTLKVTDSFDTTSPSNSLGLTGGDDALLDGDEITLTIDHSIFALGMFFITRCGPDPLAAF